MYCPKCMTAHILRFGIHVLLFVCGCLDNLNNLVLFTLHPQVQPRHPLEKLHQDCVMVHFQNSLLTTFVFVVVVFSFATLFVYFTFFNCADLFC